MKVGLTKGAMMLQAEVSRVDAVLLNATPPASASPMIIAAPARGPTQVLPQRETVMTPSGPRIIRTTAEGFHPVAAVDAFDEMARQSRRRKPDAAPLFTVGQVQAGRAYASLYERCASEGLRCSSPEARAGGGEAVDWIEGVIARSRRLDRMRAAIGDGVALSPRGVLAHADRGRRLIRVNDLVLHVCVHGRTISGVLVKFGWGRSATAVDGLKAALTGALDRMQGL